MYGAMVIFKELRSANTQISTLQDSMSFLLLKNIKKNYQEKNKDFFQNPKDFLEPTVISEGYLCCRQDMHPSSLQFISKLQGHSNTTSLHTFLILGLGWNVIQDCKHKNKKH